MKARDIVRYLASPRAVPFLILALTLSSSILSATFIFSPESLEERRGTAAYLPRCVFHCITGYDCPTCGLTRGLCAISHGEFRKAAQYNALSFIAYPVFVFCILASPFLLGFHFLAARKSPGNGKNEIN
jgi:hypothetical protein